MTSLYPRVLTPADETRIALLASSVWKRSVDRLDIMELARAGPIDLDVLSDDEHHAIRQWCKGDHASIEGAPEPIRSWFAQFS